MAQADADTLESLLEDSIPPDILETVDLSVPPETAEEYAAAEMTTYLQVYQNASIALKAARHQVQHDRADRLSKEMVFARMAIALIQQQYPGAKAIADDIMRMNAKNARANRARMRES